jgi:hypothetical protein
VQFDSFFQAGFTQTVALFLGIQSKQVAVKAIASTVLQVGGISVQYAVTYPNASTTPSIATLSAALASPSNGASFTSAYQNRLLLSAGTDPALLALINGITVSSTLSVTVLTTAAPTSAPTVAATYKDASTNDIIATSATVIIITVIVVVVGVALLAALAMLVISRRTNHKPEPERVHLTDDPRVIGLGSHAADAGRRDTYLDLKESQVVRPSDVTFL